MNLTSEQINLISCIVGVIGGVTGLASFVMVLVDKWKSRYRLKATFIDNDNMFFPAITKKKYLSDYQAVLHIILRNKSLSPITIHDAYLIVDGKYTLFEEYSENDCIQIPCSKVSPDAKQLGLIAPKEYRSIPAQRQFVPPLRLETFDAFEGIGFIPCFPCQSKQPKVTLVLKTAKRKEHKISVTVNEFKE